MFNFFLPFIAWVLLGPLPLLLGIYLVWRRTCIFRILGWLILGVWAFYWLSLTTPYYVVQGNKRVQEFALVPQLGSAPSVMWMEDPPRLLLVADSQLAPPEGDRVLSIDLETRQSQWLPKASVDLDRATRVEDLPMDYSEKRGELYVNYASPSKAGPRDEASFVGFIQTRSKYYVGNPLLGGAGTYWEQEKYYYRWNQLVVREYDSGPAVVKLNQILFNSLSSWQVDTGRWLLGGRFLVLVTGHLSHQRVLLLGPFNTASQNTLSTNNKSQE
ncbi:hypothetical protein [Chroococcidiopsis sp.]|uniref:hypothetical protein n=1 Tax=Chroococcidiopsis sp. TaxID=3088168 RepID=UPI003F30CB24